jgi:hypothetical protein
MTILYFLRSYDDVLSLIDQSKDCTPTAYDVTIDNLSMAWHELSAIKNSGFNFVALSSTSIYWIDLNSINGINGVLNKINLRRDFLLRQTARQLQREKERNEQ